MKYIYIICLLLSSFFTDNSSAATNESARYAFFMPQGALQQNRQVPDIRLMRPRHTKPVEDTQPASSDTPTAIKQISNKPQPQNLVRTPTLENTVTSESVPQNTRKSSAPARQYAQPQTQSASKATATAQPTTPKKQIIASPELSPEIEKKVQQYTLDDSPVPPQKKTAATTTAAAISPLEKLKQKSLKELLADIPYPDSDLPKFKQLYADYGMELRVLERRHKLPTNSEQEKTLAKANTLRRFEVK